MRIMHLRTVVGSGGGPEKTILNSPRFLPEDDVLLVYVRPEGDTEFDLVERAAAAKAKLIDIPELFGLDPRTFFRLRQEVLRFSPDIIHAHDYKTNLLALLCRPRGGVALTTVHGYGLGGGRLELYYWLDRLLLRQMSYVIAVSDDIEQAVLKMGVPPARVTTVDNGIDESLFKRSQSSIVAKQDIGIRADSLLVGAVGRLHPEKGFDLLIAAICSLVDAGHDLNLVIVGEGEMRGDLQSQIDGSGHADRIHLMGYRSDVLSIYEAMDVYALSSLREGLPNVLLEAMALEVPVIASSIAGIPKLIQDGQNGLLVQAGELTELTDALRSLVSDEGKRRRLAQAARQTIETHFSFSARMKKIRAIYCEVTNPRARP